MSKNNRKWSLNSDEVQMYGSVINSSGRKKASQSRSLDVTSKKLSLVHMPTGLETGGEIPHGNYSRKEMKKLEGLLLQKLFKELENKVAKKLSVPRYSKN